MTFQILRPFEFSFTKPSSLLVSPVFSLCGANFVFIFEHAVRVNGQSAMLDDGQNIALTRMAATDFKLAWGSYWLEAYSSW